MHNRLWPAWHNQHKCFKQILCQSLHHQASINVGAHSHQDENGWGLIRGGGGLVSKIDLVEGGLLEHLQYFSFYLALTVISNLLRLDKGTETGHMATIHAFLRQDNSEEDEATGEDTVHYG